MKKLVLLFGVMILLAGCTQAPPSTDETKDIKTTENITLVKDFFKAIENENIEAMKGFLSDSVVSYGPSFDYTGNLEEIVNYWTQTFKDIDSLKFDIFEIMSETIPEGNLAGDWILQWADVSFYSPTGEKKVKLMVHTAQMIEDGKISIFAEYWNQWDMYKQMGAELKWPEEKK